MSIFYLLPLAFWANMLTETNAQCPACVSQLDDLFNAELSYTQLHVDALFSDNYTLQAVDQVLQMISEELKIGTQGFLLNGNLNLRGKSGSSGDTGVTGFPGIQGPMGMAGSPGERGLHGTPGGRGNPGLTGLTGFTGLSGATGATGPTGLPGWSSGRRKRQTSSSALRVKVEQILTTCRDITTYANDLLCTFEQLNSTNMSKLFEKFDEVRNLQSEVECLYADVKFSFKLAAKKLLLDSRYDGSKGQPGSPGAWGFIGSAGRTGIKGATGIQGATGMTGYVGPRGMMGFTGASGDIGATGVTGSTGNTGITGP